MRSVLTISSLAGAASLPHENRLAQIEEIRKTPGVLWTAALNDRFAAESPGASRLLNGVKGDWVAEIKSATERGVVSHFAEELFHGMGDPPESFDSAENWPQCAKVIGDIRDQSACGCCWAFAAAEAASDLLCIATNASVMVSLSAEDICFCGSADGCAGGDMTTPWDYIIERGVVTGGQYGGTGAFGKGLCLDFSMPHCHHYGPQGTDPYPAEGSSGCPLQKSARCADKCDADATAPHNSFQSDKYSFTGKLISAGGFFQGGVKGIMKMIMAGGPVQTSFTVYSDFENYAGGIYHYVTGDAAGGHAVKIVGWGVENDVKYWKVANSWNPHWGEDGYFRIKQGECGIDETVIGSAADAKWTKKSEPPINVLTV